MKRITSISVGWSRVILVLTFIPLMGWVFFRTLVEEGWLALTFTWGVTRGTFADVKTAWREGIRSSDHGRGEG